MSMSIARSKLSSLMNAVTFICGCPVQAHLWAVACSVDRDRGCQVRGRRLESLPGIGGHQLGQLPGVAEGYGAQAMLYAFGLRRARNAINVAVKPSQLLELRGTLLIASFNNTSAQPSLQPNK